MAPLQRPIKLFNTTWWLFFCLFKKIITFLILAITKNFVFFSLQDVFQNLEKLKGNVLSLSASARRLSDKEQAENTLRELNTSYEQSMEEAKKKQNSLENLFSLWQKLVQLNTKSKS